MKTVALYNLKGGVGKSAAAVNLAYLAASDGIPTLLWDLDAQAAATWYLGLEAGTDAGAGKLLGGKSPLGREIRPTRYTRLEVLPADASFRHLDSRIGKGRDRRAVIERLIEPLGETHGLLVLDCPPSFSRLSEGVVQAADTVLCPTIPTPLSLRAWEQIRSHFDSRRYGRDKLVPFLSLVDRRRALHRQWTDEPPAELAGCLAAWIPYASQVEQMGVRRGPIETFAPRSRVAQAYRDLWQELRGTAAIG